MPENTASEGTAEPARPAATLTAKEQRLIKVQGIYAGGNSIAGIFLSVYLFRIGDLKTVCLFYGALFFMQSIQFAVAGYLLKYRSTRQVARAGLLLMCAAYFGLVLLGPEARHYPIALGLLAGFGDGLYWSSINTSEYVATHERTRNLYLSRLFSANNLGAFIGPPVAGTVIAVTASFTSTDNGYYLLFVVLIGIWLIARMQANGMADLTGSSYSLRESLHHRPSEEWTLVLVQNFLRGLWVQPLLAFSAVLLFLILDGEFQLSIASSGITLLIAGCSLLVGHALQRQPRTYWLGALVVPLGLIGFALQQNWLGVVCYAVFVQCFDLFANTSTFKVMYDAMNRYERPWTDIYHLVVERETALNTGRIIGYLSVFWLVSYNNDIDALVKALLVAAVIPVATGLIHARLRKIERNCVSSEL